MKKIFALLLSAAMMLMLFAACGGSPTPPADDAAEGDDAASTDKVVRIGVFEPSTGESGAGGKQEMLGMQYANSLTPTVDIAGETYKVELIYADNGSSTEKAPTAAQQLVSKDVSIVLGSYGSGVSIAGSDSFKNAGIPAIGVTCTNPQVTLGNTHYFRICFIDPFQGTVQAKFAMEKFQAKTAYCLAELGNDYDVGLVNYFQKSFEADGGKVISETFPAGTSDFTSYINSAKNAGADVIFSPCSIAYATQIVDQSAAQGNTIPLMAGDTWDSNKVVEVLKGKDVQLYVSTFYQEGGDKAFDEGFKAFINSNSTNLDNNGGNDMIAAVSVMGYDAYYVALKAIEAAGTTDSVAINEALWKVTHDGVSGAIAFDQESGDAIRDTAYIKVANSETGTWDFEKEQSLG